MFIIIGNSSDTHDVCKNYLTQTTCLPNVGTARLFNRINVSGFLSAKDLSLRTKNKEFDEVLRQ